MNTDVEEKKPWIQRIAQDAGQWIAGWVNPLTNQGDPSKDKSAAAYWSQGVLLQPYDLSSLFTFNALARAICCALPEWAVRNGWDLTLEGDAVMSQEVESRVRATLDDLGAHERLLRAAIWGQTFGGGLLLIGADDGRATDQPLDETNLRAIRWLRVVPRSRVVIAGLYDDPGRPHFGEAALYDVTEWGAHRSSTTRFHASRVILFPGPTTEDETRLRNGGWDQSVLDVVISALRKHDGMWDDVGAMAKDGSQAIWKIKGLASAATTGLIEHVQARIQAAELVRSVFGALMLDAEEEGFEFVSREFSGISDLLGQSAVRTAGAAQMPVTVLMGQSPAGLNATGESDLELWYARVEAWGNAVALSRLERLVQLVLLSKDGPTQGEEPQAWAVKLRDPRKLSPMQRKEIEARQSQIDAAMIASKVYLPEEVAVSRYTSEGWSEVTALDLGWRRAFLERAREAITQRGDDLFEGMLQRWLALTPEGAQPGGDPTGSTGSPAAPMKEPSGEMAPQDINKRLVSGSRGRADALRAGGTAAEGLGLRFDAHDGVAMKLPSDVAASLALDGGESAEQLHVTLAYLGKTGVLSADVLERAGVVVRAFAEQMQPLEARIGGIGRFTASGGTLDAIVALVDAPGLSAMRAGLVDLLERARVPVSKAHDFMPHVTLAYLPRAQTWALPEAPAASWVMGSIDWYVGGKRRRYALVGKATG